MSLIHLLEGLFSFCLVVAFDLLHDKLPAIALVLDEEDRALCTFSKASDHLQRQQQQDSGLSGKQSNNREYFSWRDGAKKKQASNHSPRSFPWWWKKKGGGGEEREKGLERKGESEWVSVSE